MKIMKTPLTATSMKKARQNHKNTMRSTLPKRARRWTRTVHRLLAANAAVAFITEAGSAEPTFTKVLEGPITAAYGDFRCPAWGDYDRDGDLDLFLTRRDGISPLFRNDGHGIFVQTIAGALGAEDSDIAAVQAMGSYLYY
jgi:hypothetical protein